MGIIVAMTNRWADKQTKTKKKQKIIGGAFAPPPPRGAATAHTSSFCLSA